MPRSGRIASEVDLLLKSLDEGFEKQAWHGPNLRGSIRGVTAEQAGWRPAPGRHNIWEIVVHAAYWKYAVRRRITGEKRGSFALKGSNWFLRPTESSEAAFPRDVRLLEDEHRKLREAVSSLSASDLAHPAAKGKRTLGYHLRGIALHDVYHAGQIQLLKRLQQ